METLSILLERAANFIWGPPLLTVLMGGGIILLFYSRFLPLKNFKTAIGLISGKIVRDDHAKGQLTHFQALTNALSATVGLGNIAGVAVAIHQGGAGALFWMWVSAFIGMNTKFFECSLSVKYRSKDYTGEIQGGPMYVLSNHLGKIGKVLAIMFALFGLFGTLSIFNVNQLSTYMHEYYHVPKLLVGFILMLMMGFVLIGGVKRIGIITSKVVPFMAAFYFLAGIIIIFMNINYIPEILKEIFTGAFGIDAVSGGIIGTALIHSLQIGVKRAAFSNEAGVGTAPMAHSNAKTSHPIDEGIVAMIGPFIDTIIICSITAFVILIGMKKGNLESSAGVLLTTNAFEIGLPGLGNHFVGLAIILFGTTTILGMANYNQKCWNFLFKGKAFLGNNTFILYYLVTILIGARSKPNDVINLIDFSGGMMAIPNMIITIYLAKSIMKDYKKDYS